MNYLFSFVIMEVYGLLQRELFLTSVQLSIQVNVIWGADIWQLIEIHGIYLF